MSDRLRKFVATSAHNIVYNVTLTIRSLCARGMQSGAGDGSNWPGEAGGQSQGLVSIGTFDAGRQDAGRRRLSALIKRSFSLAGHRTSVALEQEFWTALMHIAASRQQTLTALVAATDAQRDPVRPLASALRVLALQEFFPAAPVLTPS
jgi:predicted DNA-binding ribbon-helix-helix protein